MIPRPKKDFRTRQVITHEASMKPYVGFENLKNSPNGWRYDIKRWCSKFDLRLPSLPRLADASSQGISESEYFRSGVGFADGGDLEVQEIEEISMNGRRYWLPSLQCGPYFRYKTEYFYYSDDSRVQYIDPIQNKDSRNYIQLDLRPELDKPILAATFKRNPITKTPSYETKVEQVGLLSGNYLDGEELETISSTGQINWANVDTNKREFFYDNFSHDKHILWFNKDYTKTYGVVPTTLPDLGMCNHLGTSTGADSQVYYLPHFPMLADDSFHLYVATSTDFEEWTRVDTYHELYNEYTHSDKKYYLDKDLGIIYFGPLSSGGVPPLSTNIYASYTTTLRVEYEEADQVYSITALGADVNPIGQQIHQGFVAITHDTLEASSVELTIDKRSIPFTANPKLYGPIVVGSDYGLLRARATSLTGAPVPGTEVRFTMSPSVGYLDNDPIKSDGVASGTGYAFSSYQPPTSADSLGFYTYEVAASSNEDYPDHKEIIVRDATGSLDGQEEEVYLYQIQKDDLLLGYSDVDKFLASDEIGIPSWVQDAEDYDKAYDQWKSEFMAEYDIVQFSPNSDGSLPGRKVVVYKINTTEFPYPGIEDPDAVDPVTGLEGAVVPLRPDHIEKVETDGTIHYKLYYPEEAILSPEPRNKDNNIAGYWLISSRVIEFQASCFSAFYNKRIYSNKIAAKLQLPSYLLGENVSQLLKKLPLGWKLISDYDNYAAGIDGATFITINPFSGPYEIKDLVNGIDSGKWAEAPFKSVGFQFSYVESLPTE